MFKEVDVKVYFQLWNQQLLTSEESLAIDGGIISINGIDYIPSHNEGAYTSVPILGPEDEPLMLNFSYTIPESSGFAFLQWAYDIYGGMPNSHTSQSNLSFEAQTTKGYYIVRCQVKYNTSQRYTITYNDNNPN